VRIAVPAGNAGHLFGAPDWRDSEAALRELRKAVTFAVYVQEDDLDNVTRIVDRVFTLLEKPS